MNVRTTKLFISLFGLIFIQSLVYGASTGQAFKGTSSIDSLLDKALQGTSSYKDTFDTFITNNSIATACMHSLFKKFVVYGDSNESATICSQYVIDHYKGPAGVGCCDHWIGMIDYLVKKGADLATKIDIGKKEVLIGPWLTGLRNQSLYYYCMTGLVIQLDETRAERLVKICNDWLRKQPEDVRNLCLEERDQERKTILAFLLDVGGYFTNMHGTIAQGIEGFACVSSPLVKNECAALLDKPGFGTLKEAFDKGCKARDVAGEAPVVTAPPVSVSDPHESVEPPLVSTEEAPVVDAPPESASDPHELGQSASTPQSFMTRTNIALGALVAVGLAIIVYRISRMMQKDDAAKNSQENEQSPHNEAVTAH